MPVILNDKEVKNPILKLALVLGALLLGGVLLAVILPIVGIILAVVICIIVIAIPIIILMWKWGMRKLAENANINIKCDEESMERHVGPVLERRGMNKDISIISKHCDLDIQGVDQDNFIVESEDGSIFVRESEEKFELLLKEDAKVSLPATSDVKVFSGAGDVKVYHMSAVEIASGAGNVSIDELGSRAKVATAAGDVSVSFKQEAEEGRVSIATASGDATISLPENATVNYRKKVMIGSMKSVFKSSDDGKFEVKFASASGNLTIEKLKLLN